MKQDLMKMIKSWKKSLNGFYCRNRDVFFKKDLTYAFKDKVKVDKIDKMLRNLISRNIISRPIAMGHKTLKYLVHPDLLKKDEEDK